MDKFFDSNWALRITALILAFSLFFYVESLKSDGKDTASSVETDVLTEVPLEVYYDKDNFIVTGLPETVDVTIEGPKQLVVQTKLQKDFKVFVDLNSLLIGEHSVTIQTENFSDKLNVAVDPSMVNIVIEERITQEFKVEPEINSALIGDDLVLTSMEVTPNKIMITGAKSIIDSISYVKATVKSEEAIKESFSTESNVVVLNRDLNKLDVLMEPQVVTVNVVIDTYKKSIPLTLETTGEVDAGITINDLTLSEPIIEITGSKSIIDAITQLVATIDLTQITKNGDFDITLSLPEGVKRTSDKKVQVKADVTIESTTEEPTNVD